MPSVHWEDAHIFRAGTSSCSKSELEIMFCSLFSLDLFLHLVFCTLYTSFPSPFFFFFYNLLSPLSSSSKTSVYKSPMLFVAVPERLWNRTVREKKRTRVKDLRRNHFKLCIFVFLYHPSKVRTCFVCDLHDTAAVIYMRNHRKYFCTESPQKGRLVWEFGSSSCVPSLDVYDCVGLLWWVHASKIHDLVRDAYCT